MAVSLKSTSSASTLSTNNEKNNIINLSQWIPNFCIDDCIKKAICFRENLIVHSKHVPCKGMTAIGGYCISVECVNNGGCEFLVHVSSSLTVEGQFGGSKLVSSASHDLACLEEKRTEFLYTNSGYHEKELLINLDTTNCAYHVDINKTCPCNKMKKSIDLSVCSCSKLLCEGANIILSRYLALKNFCGTFSLQNLNEEGRIVSCDYKCTATECKMLHGRCIDVYTIERRMVDNCEVQVIVTYMNPNGRILKHDWQSMPYVLEINPLLHPNFSTCTTNWEEDVKLMSNYLDDKKQKTDYLADHPEIKTLLSDYVQTLLAVKPAEILSFTLKHILSATKCGDFVDNECIFEGKALKENMRRICNLCGICVDTETPKDSKFMETGMSICTADPMCKIVCDGCDGDEVIEECFCEDEASESELSCDKLSVCKEQPDCKNTCEGCKQVDRTELQACDVETNCENVCEGCKVVEKSELSPCQEIEDCKNTCEGCQKPKLEACDVQTDCLETCEGCKQPKSKLLDLCPINDDCQDTCKGCK